MTNMGGPDPPSGGSDSVDVGLGAKNLWFNNQPQVIPEAGK